MNVTAKRERMQEAVVIEEDANREQRRRQQKSGDKKDRRRSIRPDKRTLEKDEIIRRSNELLENMRARTWRDLETHGKFDKNDKLSFISDDMLIVGCDIGSEKHYIRAIDTRGRELSRKAFDFTNDREGFEQARDWMVKLAAENNKKQIVLGLEPTGHYWFDLAMWMIDNGVSVVQVNPYAVKQTKEVEDNSQLKNDEKDPKTIANLVKDGNYGMPYLPEGVYADLRRLSMFRDQLTEDRIRCMNRLHREMKIFFPEYKDALGKIDGLFAIALMKEAPFPKDLMKLGEDGIREVWKRDHLRGRGYSRASEIIKYAETSVGMKEGAEEAKQAVIWFTTEMERIMAQLEKTEETLSRRFRDIPNAEKVLDIPGIGDRILSGILAEMGDIERFDDVKEIQKLSGLGLVACSSGKHKGETRISHRGRKRLRYWLFQAAKSVVVHDETFGNLHNYYTTRNSNPLKKMQSLIAIACKLLRVICVILKKGVDYDPVKLKAETVYPMQMTLATT